MNNSLKIPAMIIGAILALVAAGLIMAYLWDHNKTKNAVDHRVYEPDKVWKFRADFYNKSGDLVQRDTILLSTYNQRFLFFQNKITWSIKKGNTTTEETTGIIENENRLWLHPPRFDDYTEFTEYSAFPEIKQPPEPGQTWNTHLILGTFATKETGPKMKVTYRVENIDTLTTAPLNREITILGEGVSGLGTYKNLILFTDESGFIKMTYTKENNEKLIIELIEKTDRI